MVLDSIPRPLLYGLALTAFASVAHLALEVFRGAVVLPEFRQESQYVAESYEAITAAQTLAGRLAEAERAERAYLITGNPNSRERFEAAGRDAKVALEHLDRLATPDGGSMRPHVAVLDSLVNVRISEMTSALGVRDSGATDAARQLGLSSSGLATQQSISATIDALIKSQREALDKRFSARADLEARALRGAILGALLSLAVLTLGVLLVYRAFQDIAAANARRSGSEERFRLLANSATDYAMYVLDPAGNVIEWNDGAQRIKGYTADEIIGQHFSVFYTEEDQAAGIPQAALEKALDQGFYHAEGFRKRKDGRRFLASVEIDPLRDAAGQLIGFAKITRDISESRQQQEALAQYAKMDALGQLTGGIAHDFNNLIHVIKNALEAVQRKVQNQDGGLRTYFDMALRNADRAAGLTHRLLAFSRRQVLMPKPIQPNALLSDMQSLLRQTLGEHIAVEAVLGAGAWWIFADANQLETAILNLALNARDAMPEGGKLTLEISNAFLDERYASQHSEVKAGQYVMISVSDTGVGMERAVVEKAFEPFFTTKEVGGGTGLGLSQVFGFMKQSGGHAKIYSELGHGTTVKLYLPRLVEEPVQERRRQVVEPARAIDGKTILVVEDDTDVRRFTEEALASLGYRVLSAGDGPTALKVLAENPSVDLLFTDVGLPGGMNGRKLADEAKIERPELKVLFTTAYTRNAIIHHGRLDSGVDLISKPYEQSALAAKLREMLG
jgi:PAS domain S-box-containing protein